MFASALAIWGEGGLNELGRGEGGFASALAIWGDGIEGAVSRLACAGPACGRFMRMPPAMACDLYVAAREPRAVILGCPIGPSHIESGAEVAPHLSAAEQEQDWIREQTCLGKSPPEAFGHTRTY